VPRSTHRRLFAAAALTALAVPLAAVPPAGAGTFERAKVVRVIDGDTIDVDRNHDGRIDARIRLLGIDAPEHGLCGFAAATKALQSLVRHKTVELRSDRGRIGKMGRPERRVIVRVGATMVDASTWMLEGVGGSGCRGPASSPTACSSIKPPTGLPPPDWAGSTARDAGSVRTPPQCCRCRPSTSPTRRTG